MDLLHKKAQSYKVSNKYDLFCAWQYGLWSFQMGGTKLERFLPKSQHTQRKLLNSENWCNGELSNIGHHFIGKNSNFH